MKDSPLPLGPLKGEGAAPAPLKGDRNYQELARRIKAKAAELGFDMCGIAPAVPSAFKAEFRDWLERGFHGEMDYMARNPERRLDPQLVMPGAKSIVVAAMNYYTESEADTSDPDRAIFARYARGDDYHDVMGKRLRELLAFIKAEQPFVAAENENEYEYEYDSVDEGLLRLSLRLSYGGERGVPTGGSWANDYARSSIGSHRLSNSGGEGGGEIPNSTIPNSQSGGVPTDGRVYVDTGPILEREVAQRAGIGWFGKNTMLINTRRGSYFLLGEILLNLPFPPDKPAIGGCGTCTKCIDACPTQAIVAPFKVDSRRCISYLTIELKGPIPEDLAPKIGNRIFGCDICQEVCPFNERRAAPTKDPAFQPRQATIGQRLSNLAEISEEEFQTSFRKSPIKRAKWRGLVRNAIAGQTAESEGERL